MNASPQKLEELLRKAPKIAVPAGLREKLEADIFLPRERTIQNSTLLRQSIFRRWLPVLSLSCWLIACLILFAVQSSVVSGLKRELAALRGQTAANRSENGISAEQREEAEMTRLRAGSAEAERLRAEVAELRQQLSTSESLRAQNEKMAAELQSRGAAGKPKQDFFAATVEKHERLKCINNIKQVGLAARIYANDHKEIFPTDYASMKDEIADEIIIHCPSNPATTYEILSPGVEEGDPNIVFIRCPVHNNVGLTDGSAQQLGDRFQVIRRADGKFVVGKVN